MESVKRLIKHFEEGCLSSAAIESIKKDCILKTTKELQYDIARLDGDLIHLQDFLSSLQYLVKHNNSCVSDLFDQGLLDLIKVVFEQVLRRTIRDGPSETMLAAIELCTETANVLADTNSKAKGSVVLELCTHFLDFLQVPMLGFQTRLEVLKSTNNLLEQCPTSVKEILLNSEDNGKKMSDLVDLVKTVGDYEFQVGIIECLMRVFPRKSRPHFAAKFFSDGDMLERFLAIKDKDFETDCRLFLNSVNAKSQDPSKGVFSLPCIQALLGSKQLKKPSDAGYEEFWVDFNIGSERLTLFCEQDSLYSQETQMDEELWETVAIYKSDVLQCAFHEQNGVIELEISLKSPVCDLYPSQHQDVDDNKIRINFYPELEEHIAHAVGCTFDFGEKKSKVSTVNTPLQISMKKVQDNDLMRNVKYFNPDRMIPSPAQTCSHDSVSRRRKISVPSVPMTIPIISPVPSKIDQQETVEDSIPETQMEEPFSQATDVDPKMSVSVAKDNQKSKRTSKESTKDFAVPKTPVKKTRSKVKVKTPVVTVTPPSRKTRKQSVQSNAAEGESVSSQTLPKECEQVEQEEVVIPDSLPFYDSLFKPEKANTVKASVSNKVCMDDSGIGADESRSSIVCDALDTTKDSQAADAANTSSSISAEKGKTRKPPKKKKGLSTKSLKTKKAEKQSLANSESESKDVENGEEILTPLKEVKEEQEIISAEENKAIPNENTANENNFDFDSVGIDDQVVSIPDSLENSISSDKQSNTEEKSKDMSKANTHNKGKKQKKVKNKKGTYMNESNDTEVNVVDKNNDPQMPIDIKAAEDSSMKNNEVKSKKSFTDIDKSLKELNDLDRNEDISKESKVDIGGKSKRSKTGKSEKHDETDDVYTFSEPDSDIHKSERANQLVSKARKDNKRSKSKSAMLDKQEEKKKLKSVGSEGKQEESDSLEIEQRSSQGNDDSKECTENANHNKSKIKKDDKLEKSRNEKCDDEFRNKDKEEKIENEIQHENKKGVLEQNEKLQQKTGRAKRKEKDYKEDNRKSIETNKGNPDAKVGRSLRRRGNQKYKELESSGSDANSSPSCSNETKESPENQLSSSDLPTDDVTTDGTPEKGMEKRTPDNSPNKSAVMEQKIKSSLKKNKNSSDSNRDMNKRKSRVSFDLPNRCSPESDPILITQHQEPQTESVESENKIPDVFQDNDFANVTDQSIDLEQEAAEVKENNESETLPDAANRGKPSAEYTSNKKSNKGNRSKKLVKQEKGDIEDKYALSKLIPSVSSPMSYSDSSDSLYIESDDSYNKRRYNMENDRWNSSKRKRRSSLKPKRKGTGAERIEENKKFGTRSDNSRALLKEVGKINEQNTTKGTDRSKKNVNKSKEKGMGSLDKNTADKENVNCNNTDKSYLSKSIQENRNRKVATGDENNLLERECFREENQQFDAGLNIEMDDLDEINDSHGAVVPYGNFNEDNKKEKAPKGKKKGSSDKKTKGNSIFSMSQSFEKVECDDTVAVSQQSIQTVSNAKGKSMVFQMSYLKSKTNNWCTGNSWNAAKPSSKLSSYDPYDFDAHCEKNSVTSQKNGKMNASKTSKLSKTRKKKRSKSKECKVKAEKEINSSFGSQDSFSQDFDSQNVSNSKEKSSGRAKLQSRNKSKSKRDYVPDFEDLTMNNDTDIPDDNDNNLQENCSQEMMIDLTHVHRENKKPAKTTLVQDQKTKKWYRTDKSNPEENADNDRKENKRHKVKKEKETKEFPSMDSFNKSIANLPNEDEPMIIDSSMEQNNISQFSKILKEITMGRQMFGNDINLNINADLEEDIAEAMTPCIESITSTPKVESGKRKQYKPLNVSVIRTPQSCQLTDSEDDEEIQKAKAKQNKRKCRKKRAVKYMEASESASDSEDGKSECKSRMSTESVSLLDSSQNISNRSEKSWILERKKTPKFTKASKTYKANKKNKNNRCQQAVDDSGDSSDDEEEMMNDDSSMFQDKLQKMRDYLQQAVTPLSNPSLSLNRLALTPSMELGMTPSIKSGMTPSIKSLKSLEDLDDFMLTPPSPKKRNRKGKEVGGNTEVEQTRENCSISLNLVCPNRDEDWDSVEEMGSQAVASLKSFKALNQNDESDDDDDDEDRSLHKLLQQNMKLLGDGGFNSGPSSEVRPSKSTLKRRFPDIVESRNVESSDSSQVVSDDEMERSVFIPKKLFKFDPAVNTPQAPSVYSDVTEEHEVDYGFQSGFSTVMAAFGADIQHHLKSKKQKIERFTKETLKETQKHFHHTIVEQQQYLSNITDDLTAKMLLEITALEKDIDRLGDAEKKMEEYFKSQLETLRCNEESQSKRLNNMRKLHSSFLDKSKKVNKYNYNAHKNLQEQLKKEMAALQKKLMAETQRQQFMDVKMKLQKMF